MENATKAILFGAAIVITLVLVSLGFLLLNNATGSVNQQVSDMEQQKQEVLDQKYTKYDGKVVSGSEVLSALEEFKDDGISILVKTKRSTGVGTYYYWMLGTSDVITTSSGAIDTLDDAKDKTDTTYINPSGKFDAKVLTDTNKAITGISFTQQ
ncbi:MAG TPA: hypothetical protein VHT96_06785 [Clostridia bacterium]|nr:hypothetical protein [Clostridia bacterium]